MLCKWCGMESTTTDKCSWCHRPFSTSAAHAPAPQAAPPPSRSAPPVGTRQSAPLATPDDSSNVEDDGSDAADDSPLAHGRTAHGTPWAPAAPPQQPQPQREPYQQETRDQGYQPAPAPPQVRTSGPPSTAPQVRAPAPGPGIPQVRTSQGGHVPAPAMPQVRPAAPSQNQAASSPTGRLSDTGAGTPQVRSTPGSHTPAPGMPPLRTQAPSPGIPVQRTSAGSQEAPHRHVPAPAILPISEGRGGGAAPKSPYASAPPPASQYAPAPPPTNYVPPSAPVVQQPAQGATGRFPVAAPPAQQSAPAPSAPPQRSQPSSPAVPYVSYNKAAPASAPAQRPQPPPVQVRQTAAERFDPSARGHAASIAHGMPVAEPGGLADGMAAQRRVSAAEMHLPSMGVAGAEQSKYYAGQVVDATSGTHYDAATGRPTESPHLRKEPELEIEWEPVTSMATLVARYLCALAGIVALTCLLAHAYREYYVLTLIASMFGAGLLLPIMNVVPKQRDDSDDVWIFMGVTMVFGPAIGLIIYAVIGLLRQSANPAVVGCFIVSIVLQLAVYLAASPTLLLFGPPWVQTAGFDVRVLLVNWCSVAALVGWASANVFHRFDE